MRALSLGQERLWFLDQITPGDPSSNIQMAKRVRGLLDLDALQRAVDVVVARHDSLRSRFPSCDGEPTLVVDAVVPIAVERLDVSPLTAQDREAEALRLLAQRSNAPFDLAAGPLLRVTCVRLAADDHIVAPVLHHSVSDGWSTHLFVRELATLLGGGVLRDLPMQFPDFAEQQRRQQDDAAASGSLDYWVSALRDLPALELPSRGGDGPVDGQSAGIVSVVVPGDVADRLDELARARRCTPYMVLMAAYQVLLARHSGQEDFGIGTPTAGRDDVATEHLIGYFSSTLVLRADLAGDPTFAELLVRVRRTALAAYTHSQIPFEKLLSTLQLDRSVTRTALFQTMLTLHTEDSLGIADLDVPGLTFADFDAGLRAAKFDLTVDIWRKPDCLEVQFLYDNAMLDERSAGLLAERFQLLLRSIVEAPDSRVSDLEILTPDDRAQLAAWGTGPDVEAHPPTVLAAIPFASPAVAVVCGDESLTYDELDRRSDRLAGALREAGVQRGDTVGIRLPRSIDGLVAILAIWRSGAAYLPIDPGHPADRVAFMLADSGTSVVVSDVPMPVRTVHPRAVGAAGPVAPAGDDIAYVIYTSGSTGTPKGVAVPHRALASRVAWMRAAYEMSPSDRVPQFASLSFDTHAEELYPCLTAGGTVALLPDGGTGLPELLDSAAGRGVTVLDLPTSYWHELVADLHSIAWPDTLRLVILGGDAVNGESIDAFRAFLPGPRVMNTYGPTETTIIATATPLGGGERTPPIGVPIGDTVVEVRDPAGRLVPPGTPGELWIGGAGVAAGYVDRPELTAERFVDGGYRSGDRAAWGPDGQLTFLGRLDNQFKVRGFRIEAGEIEACLQAVPGVHQALVLPRDQSVVAYVVGAVAAADLRTHCAASLPSYMVPNIFVPLERLPLTINGKVDVRALPAPDQSARSERPYVEPRTDAEALVAEVWADVLGIGRVGALDDFFDIGGHSLLATKVVARLSAIVGVRIPIRALFTATTLEGFAVAVEDALAEAIDDMTDEDAEALLAAAEPTPA